MRNALDNEDNGKIIWIICDCSSFDANNGSWKRHTATLMKQHCVMRMCITTNLFINGRCVGAEFAFYFNFNFKFLPRKYNFYVAKLQWFCAICNKGFLLWYEILFTLKHREYVSYEVCIVGTCRATFAEFESGR